MKLKSLSLAAVLLLAVSAFAGTFTSPAGRFTADFVTEPTTESRDVKTSKGDTVTVYSFFAKAADKSLGEDIDYADFAVAPTTEELIDTAKSSFGDRELDGVGKTVSQGRTWILAAGHDEKLVYFYAITCVGKRVFEVTVAAPAVDQEKVKIAESLAEDFLGSIKITE